jgi:hypothetical protein
MATVVAVNEDIKKVIRIAEQIDLAAINAMLIAKKVGQGQSGFSVVSAELRNFSHLLGNAMQQLQQRVAEMVNMMAQAIGAAKMLALLQETQRGLPASAIWEEVLARRLQARRDNQAAAEQLHGKLLHALARAEKLCAMGLALSYSAKVEAVYGGERSDALKQVSADAERAIADILHTLKGLSLQLEHAR